MLHNQPTSQIINRCKVVSALTKPLPKPTFRDVQWLNDGALCFDCFFQFGVCCLDSSFILELAALFEPGDGPGEVRNGDDEEAVNTGKISTCYWNEKHQERWAHLLESSRIPAKALYHAVNAASRPKNPPALMIGGFGTPLGLRCRYPMPSSRNVMSSVKKRVKNATVERSVASKRTVVKINQPC